MPIRHHCRICCLSLVPVLFSSGSCGELTGQLTVRPKAGSRDGTGGPLADSRNGSKRGGLDRAMGTNPEVLVVVAQIDYPSLRAG